MARKRTILMYARSRGGKTSLLAELIEHVQVTQGKKGLVYSIDKGGIGPLSPYIDLGIVDLVEQHDLDPWVFLYNAVRGKVRDEKGKWVQADLSKYGVIGFESMTGWADSLMDSLAEKAANNINIGGSANVSFQVQGDGETVKIGGANQSHYGIVQGRILKEVWTSQKLNAPYIVWTAAASKEDDLNASGKVIGPAVVGKALTAEVPRHFDLTFRLDCLPASQGKQERHILYLGNSVDMAAGNAVGLGNTRVPLGAPELPASIEPASLVKALQLIEDAENKAKEAIKARLAQKK